MGDKKTNTLLKIFEQNWLHIRHIERERMICLNVYVAILAAVFYVIAQGADIRHFLPYFIAFILMFSVINFLLSVKIEAVIEDYTRRNEEIVKKLKLEEYAGLRVKFGVWRFIRLKYIFPSFYGIMIIALLIFFIII